MAGLTQGSILMAVITIGMVHFVKGECKRGLFRCRNGHCISASLQCNGFYDCGDYSDEYECEGSGSFVELPEFIQNLQNIAGVNEANKKLAEWFLKYRKTAYTTTNKWRLQAHRIATVLYLLDKNFFEDENRTGDELRYEIAIQTLTKLSESDEFSSQELALHVNALLVTCINPKDFNGQDLVAELRRRVEAKSYTNPYEILVLCNAGDTMTITDIERVGVAFDSHHRPMWFSTQAIAILALKCITNKFGFTSKVTDSMLTKMVRELKINQARNGSVGDLKDTALVLQALIATDEFGENFDLEGAVKSILVWQKLDGSFGTLLNSYHVLPVFNHKSLLDISTDHCNIPHMTGAELTNLLRRKKGNKVKVRFSVLNGKDSDFGKTWTLNVPENSSFYDVIELISSLDFTFQVGYSVSNHKPFISAVSGIENDPEMGLFWFTYVKNSTTAVESNIVEQSPVDIRVQQNQELILWYRNGKWRED